MSKKKNAPRGAGRRKKPGTGARLVLAAVTCLNLALTLALSLQRRRDVLRAVSQDGQVKLLLEKASGSSGKES